VHAAHSGRGGRRRRARSVPHGDDIKTALAASKGEHVPTNVDTGANIITKASMNSTRPQELLNPKID
jgi:hypothetical protein